MKTIETVRRITAMAEARAHYVNGDGIATIKRDGIEVYRVQYRKDDLAGDTVELYHYGTKTAELWKAYPTQVMHVYGESRSDADSVNTFMDYHGMQERYTYRPVNGGFMEVK